MPPADLALLALLLAGLAAASLLLRGRLPREEPAVLALPPELAAAPPPPAPWDEDAELRKLADGNPEIQALYEKIGYSSAVERDCERLLRELESLVRAEIPDWKSFADALAAAEAQLAAAEAAGEEPSGAAVRGEDEELLRAVLRAHGDRPEILRLLNEDPVGRLLPFLEQLPLVRHGEVVWRTPMELTLVRRRAADPVRFLRCLDDLERRVRTSPLRRKPPAREVVLAALSRLRRDVARENAYLPSPLRALSAALDDWLHRSHEPALQKQRQELDNLLRGLLRVRHAYESGAEPPPHLRATARDLAHLYAGQPWMQTPWLTACTLTGLLDAELAAVPKADREQPVTPAGVVRLVRDEVASLRYDSDESIRRLHLQEEQGFYVHSLVYALLRLNRLPAAAESVYPLSGRREA